MQYGKLGNSGAVVSAFTLGTMTFGAEADEATSFQLMDDYIAGGGNFLDTADVYSAGKSEEIVGRWLKARPDAAKQALLVRTPLQRTGTPEEVAEAVRWLLRDATYTTGQVLRLDGGRLLDA